MFEMLQFEREWETRTGSKAAAVRDTFNISLTRYYQWLHQEVDNPAGVEFDPELVHRLQRLREVRTAARRNGEFCRV